VIAHVAFGVLAAVSQSLGATGRGVRGERWLTSMREPDHDLSPLV
jgi:hypothetical protein